MSQSLILPLLIVVLAIPMFFSFRKQKKMQQQQQQLQNSIGAGDRVMTTSGLYGTVTATNDTTIDVEIAPGMVTTWLRQAIREKVQTEDTSATAEEAVEASNTSGAEVAEPLEHKAK